MDQGQEEAKQVDWTQDWDTYYKEARDNLTADIATLETTMKTARDRRTVADQNMAAVFSWLVISHMRQRRHLEMLNDHRQRLLRIEEQMKKLAEVLNPLTPYLPVLTKFAEEKKREFEEREKFR